MDEISPDEMAADAASVSVRVARSGGMAGVPRVWHADATGPDARFWAALIDRCAWDEEPADVATRGADRFVWAIRARCGETERTTSLPDGHVRGPWRDLVDEVRARGTAGRE
jgi:hypothetical protein